MTIVAGIPKSCAESATAWAWFPEELVTTPRTRVSGVSAEMAL
jgi:hypothetical protein